MCCLSTITVIIPYKLSSASCSLRLLKGRRFTFPESEVKESGERRQKRGRIAGCKGVERKKRGENEEDATDLRSKEKV